MLTLAWLPSCVWCPPLLYRCVRRRFGPDMDGCSGVDIVSFVFVVVFCRRRRCVCVVELCCVVVIVVVFFLYLLPWLMWGVDVGACWCDGSFFSGGDGWFYPIVFVGWVIGLVCGRSGLLEFFDVFISDVVFGFKS